MTLRELIEQAERFGASLDAELFVPTGQGNHTWPYELDRIEMADNGDIELIITE